MLDKLYKEYLFPIRLYADIRKNIEQNYMRDLQAVSEFVEDLPVNFKQRISIHIYKDLVQSVAFLRGKK